MSDTPSITTWAVNEAPDGSPLVNASPSDIDLERADAVLRLSASARRYSAEAVRADVATARRLAARALATVYGDADAWQHVRPSDLVPDRPAAAPAPERPDRGALTPADPRWAAEARALLEAGYPDPEAREAARGRLIPAALAGGWTLKQLGHAILRARAEAADRLHISALHAPDLRDPVALAAGHDDSADVWSRVTRPPQPGEVTNELRARTGF